MPPHAPKEKGIGANRAMTEKDIRRIGTQSSGKAAQNFTGTVRIDPLFTAPERRASSPRGHFRAGRAHLVAHPSAGPNAGGDRGCGRMERWGGPVEEIRPGDTVWICAGEKHWHGAAPATAMTHLAIQDKSTENRRVAGKSQRRAVSVVSRILNTKATLGTAHP